MGKVTEQLTQLKMGVFALLLISAGTFGAIATTSGGFASLLGGGEDPATDTPDTSTGDLEFNGRKDLVGIEFPARTESEAVVLVPTDGSGNPTVDLTETPDVTMVGSDSDDSDETELINAEGPEEGEDYYYYTTFDSQITSDVPDSGDYRYAVIGGGVVNEFGDLTIQETVSDARVDNGNALNLIDDEADSYAENADVSQVDTRVRDGSQVSDILVTGTGDFSSESDGNVDGTVTGTADYEIANNERAQFGELSVSSVNDSVDEVTVTVFVDGNEVVSESDSDFGDGEGLDDGVEIGPEVAEDEFRVETAIDFDDASMTNAGDLVTTALDDTDEDGDSQDGSYGVAEVSQTYTGY